MIQRKIEHKLREYASQYPVVTVTGPRQSGKTTLCKSVFPSKPYVNLELPDVRDFAEHDPRGFLKRYPDGAVIDEIQRVPGLVSYIQGIVDEQQKDGMFILTGSHQFELTQVINQSLAGRTALLRLLPFSIEEIYSTQTHLTKQEVMYKGFYPRIHDKNLNPSEAYSFYTATYIERDLRTIININDLSRFMTFLKLCAGRSAQILNLSSLGNECGVSHNTIKSWISVLEASYILYLLPPYYNNHNKRLIKSPKLYFIDTGLACSLLGIQESSHLESHPLAGSLFENMIVMDFLKSRYNAGKSSNLYFYRDSSGNEVDLIHDNGVSLDITEIKSSETVSADYMKGLKHFKGEYAEVNQSQVVYGGDELFIRENVEFRPWYRLE